MSPATDGIENGPDFHGGRNLFDENAIGFVMERAQRVENEGVDPTAEVSFQGRREFPIAGYASPGRVGLHRIGRPCEAEYLLKISGREGLQMEDFRRAAEQGRFPRKDKALHHALTRTGQCDDQSRLSRIVVDPLLENARELGGGDYEVGELVEHDGSTPPEGRCFAGEPAEEGSPVRVLDIVESWKTAGYSLRKVSTLNVR